MDGLGFLLEMNGQLVNRADGYWYKIEAYQVEPTKHRPHGIRYNLTLHDKYNRRIFGIDNAHGVKIPKRDALPEVFISTIINTNRLPIRAHLMSLKIAINL